MNESRGTREARRMRAAGAEILAGARSEPGRVEPDERKAKHDPDTALEVWRGLVTGRWSLVDHFDTDGKRYVLARENAPQVERRHALTPRERRVASLAATGHRDKEIAYTLGLSMGSVVAAMHRARRKLGVTSRAQLAVIWRRGCLAGCNAVLGISEGTPG